MLTLFFDSQGLLLVDFKDPGVFITRGWYCETLERLRRLIKAKRPGKLRNGVILFIITQKQTTFKNGTDEITLTLVGDTRALRLHP